MSNNIEGKIVVIAGASSETFSIYPLIDQSYYRKLLP